MQDTKLVPSALKTGGSGSALQVIPKRKQKVIYIEVNSYDRNFSLYNSSSEFQWAFPTPLKDVIRIDIVEGSLPVPLYNVDEGWNKFTLDEDKVHKTVTLTPGYYTVDTLIVELQTQINLVATNVYAVSIPNPSRGKIRIHKVSGTALRFALMFGSGDFIDAFDMQNFPFFSSENQGLVSVNCPGKLLGFESGDVLDVNGTIFADHPPDLNSMLRRIYLYLNFDATMDLTSVKRGLGRKEPSGIFYCDADNPPGSIKCLNKDTWNNTIYPGPAPISRIRMLTISLRDQFYRRINVNGKEMSLLLEITMLE